MAEDKQLPEFEYTDLLPLLKDPYLETEFNHLGNSGVSEVEGPDGKKFLKVEEEALRLITSTAMRDIAHLFRTSHLSQLAEILEDPEPSDRNLPNSFSNAIDIVIRSPKKPLSSAIATEQKRAINVEIRDIPFSLCE